MPRLALLKFMGHTLKRDKYIGSTDIILRAHVVIRLGPTTNDRVSVGVYHRKYGGSVAHCSMWTGYVMEQTSGASSPQSALDELESLMRSTTSWRIDATTP